jgi:hypothetical protein
MNYINNPTFENNDKLYRVIYFENYIMIVNEPYGRIYNNDQIVSKYNIPNWKIHFRIDQKDLHSAWNILTELFLKYLLYDIRFDNSNASIGRNISLSIPMTIPMTIPMIDRKIWFEFIIESDKLLSKNKIKPGILNPGDKKINNYCSMRNDAYCYIVDHWTPPKNVIWNGYNYSENICSCQWVYPPDEYGHNAHNDEEPFSINEYKWYKFKKCLRKYI